MARVITDYLEESCRKYPRKTAYIDETEGITFSALRNEAMHIACGIVKKNIFKKPVAIYMAKSVHCISAFLGVAYSGNFYTMIDVGMPAARIDKILSTLEPEVIITDSAYLKEVEKLRTSAKVLVFQQLLDDAVDEDAVLSVTHRVTDSDVLYVLFTSGSSGIPKGVITSHRAVIGYMEAATDAYSLDEHTVIGNQAPLYFVLSIIDVYATLKNGGTTYLIPKEYFSFPGKLVRYVAENQLTLLNWVCSALCIVANLKALKKADMSCVKTVIFGGEMMPVKQLNAWIDALPNTSFVNAYGSTEVTDGATYYVINRRFRETDLLPLGKPFNNTDILILDDDNRVVSGNEIGELCCRGNNLSYGYYDDLERTRAVFVQNPLNDKYAERIYRTGDLVRYNEYGEIEYIGRKDFQIKHMGHRVELGEIEINASSIQGIDENCCIYDFDEKRIVMFYTGSIDSDSFGKALKELVPSYMIPSEWHRLEKMPHNVNEKIDRAMLKEMVGKQQ